jgi:hypothetical protein
LNYPVTVWEKFCKDNPRYKERTDPQEKAKAKEAEEAAKEAQAKADAANKALEEARAKANAQYDALVKARDDAKAAKANTYAYATGGNPDVKKQREQEHQEAQSKRSAAGAANAYALNEVEQAEEAAEKAYKEKLRADAAAAKAVEKLKPKPKKAKAKKKPEPINDIVDKAQDKEFEAWLENFYNELDGDERKVLYDEIRKLYAGEDYHLPTWSFDDYRRNFHICWMQARDQHRVIIGLEEQIKGLQVELAKYKQTVAA